jgi:hypothetical protein
MTETKPRATVVNLYHEPYNVYIGREGRWQDGYFGNPSIAGQSCAICGQVHTDGPSTLPCFEKYARKRISQDPEFRQKVKELQGRTLGCFCKPKPCHGDILATLAEELNRQS